MKIRNAVLFDVNFIEALLKFTEIQLPVKVSYPLKKCLNLFQTEEKELKSSREELFKKYGKEIVNEINGEITYDVNKADRKDQEKFIEEFNDLMGLEIELPFENKLVLSIKSIEDKEISVKHLNAIEPLIDFQD